MWMGRGQRGRLPVPQADRGLQTRVHVDGEGSEGMSSSAPSRQGPADMGTCGWGGVRGDVFQCPKQTGACRHGYMWMGRGQRGHLPVPQADRGLQTRVHVDGEGSEGTSSSAPSRQGPADTGTCGWGGVRGDIFQCPKQIGACRHGYMWMGRGQRGHLPVPQADRGLQTQVHVDGEGSEGTYVRSIDQLLSIS